MGCRQWISGFAVGMSALLAGQLEAQFSAAREGLQISFAGGVDISSSYVWRGLELNEGLNIQPYVALSTGLLEIGTWGSHSQEGDFHEQDFWASYFFPTGPRSPGQLSLTVTDYYVNPDFGDDLFDFRGVGPCPAGQIGFGTPPRCARGAHTVEVTGAYSSNVQPFDVLIAYNFHNDPEDSIYLEGAIRPVVLGFELRAAAGGLTGRSRNYYGNEEATIINLSGGISRTISFGSLRLPLSAEVIHNPDVGDTYYVARAGLGAGN